MLAEQPPLAPSYDVLLRNLRATFDSGRTRPAEWRRAQLESLERLLREQETRLLAALHEDLGKPALEARMSEVAFVAADARDARKHLRRWMSPERVSTPLAAQPGRSRIHHEPLGVVLVIAPWNYPLQLALSPAAGALAAGNCLVIKPSEVAPSTAQLLAELVPRYLDPDAVQVVTGGVAETTALLAERFDHVFYTGNAHVGRIVMTAAAKHLTPVTLELGGKSPCIVDQRVNLQTAAHRIAWSKFFNAGQTCVAPDYVLVHRSRMDALCDALARTVREFYGDDPSVSPDYGRIVSVRHHDRLVALLGSGRVVCGGQQDREARYVAPTVLRDVPPDAPVMQEEIFGPILPVLAVDSLDEAIAFVNARPKPLALYLFSEEAESARAVLERTSSGGMVVNHALIHLTIPGLPFGGVGDSGMGAYHGRESFLTFTHRKSVLAARSWPDVPVAYPPYTAAKQRWLPRLL